MFSKKPASQTVEALKTKLSGTVVADHDKEYDAAAQGLARRGGTTAVADRERGDG